tara:strand:+ start:647 stop:1381 length:735 start_codon:yes stop_codon:yes gene_type:complete
MGYATPILVKRVIAQSMTTSTSDTLDSKELLINFGNQFDSNLITDDILNEHIRNADMIVNGSLSEMYKTPLKEYADLEVGLASDIDPYNGDIVLSSPQAGVLVPGDILVLTDGVSQETHSVLSVINDFTVETIDEVAYVYSASSTRILRIRYPDPIPLISARLTAANVYDKYFASQANPNVSDFGKTMRTLATNSLNNILNGRTILHGQMRIGNRFFNSNLQDRYNLPGAGADQDSSRDLPGLT